jgi:hypothetical protein
MKKLMVVALVLAMTAGVVSASEEEARIVYIPVHTTLIPGFPEAFGVKVRTNVSLSMIIDSVYRVDGIQAAGVMAVTEEDVRGAQAAGVGTVTGGGAYGVQSAGVFAVSEGGGYWLQSSGVFNVSNGPFHGAQLAGVFNVAEDRMNGVQSAGVFNVADRINGAQFAVVNVAREVRGVQVGIVNISDDMHGIPIGLVNIVRNGILNLTAWSDGGGYTYVGLQKGSRNLYTILYGGARNQDYFHSYDSLTAGLGLGLQLADEHAFVDFDVTAKHVVGADWWRALELDGSVFPSARLSAGLNVGRRLAILGGVSADAHIPGITRKSVFHTGDPLVLPAGSYSVELYPQFFLGAKL